MARMSDEQWKDLKMKITAVTILGSITIAVLAVGPGLPYVHDYVRNNKESPSASSRYYKIGKLYEWTFRVDKAQKVYVEAYHLWCGDEEAQYDEFVKVLDDRNIDDDAWAYYIPWEAAKYNEDNPRPTRIGDTRDEYFGKMLLSHAKYWERKKRYEFSRHIYACLFFMWPEGSEIQQSAAKARLRDAGRSF